MKKKLVLLCLIVILTLSIGITVFAYPVCGNCWQPVIFGPWICNKDGTDSRTGKCDCDVWDDSKTCTHGYKCVDNCTCIHH